MHPQPLKVPYHQLDVVRPVQAPKAKSSSSAKKPKESAERKRLRLEEEARAAEAGTRSCNPAILGAHGLTSPSISRRLAQSESAWRQRPQSRRKTTRSAARAWLRSAGPRRAHRPAPTGGAPLTLTSVVLKPVNGT